MTEKVYVVQPLLGVGKDEVLYSEAIALIESAGAAYAGTMQVRIREINPATFLGEGKVEELRERIEGLDLTVLFNGTLSPSQTVNLSEALGGAKVIDRTTLILDIFALRAQSSEGKLQVELAQLKYLYPRLKGKEAPFPVSEAASVRAARAKHSWRRTAVTFACASVPSKKSLKKRNFGVAC